MSDTASLIHAGALLMGKYRLERLLGQGGMGSVFLAENKDIGRKVAIKVLHANFATDAGLLARFRQEARAAAAIGHPGIVDVLDMGTLDDGAAFIVMERLEGETLGERLTQVGRLPMGSVQAIVGQVFDALAAAHEKGIIHRDLKPDNIFLVERPVAMAKLLDFGISKLQGTEDLSLTRTGAVMGTPLYMSPEQARGAKDISASTDLYSMGAILYHALAGKPPFLGETYNEVLAKVLIEDPPPLSEARSDLPSGLVSLVHSLLSKNPGQRPPSTRAAKSALEVACSGSASADGVAATLAAPAGSTPAPALAYKSPAVSLLETHEPARGAVAMGVPSTDSLPAKRRGAPMAVILGMVVAISLVAFFVLRGRSALAPPSRAAETREPTRSGEGSVARVEPPPSPSLAASPPAKIEITLEADPASARWSLDGEPLGCNPCRVVRDAQSTHVATATANGHAQGRVEILFDRPRTEHISLLETKAAGGGDKPLSRKQGEERPKDQAREPARDPERPPKKDRGLSIDRKNPFNELTIDKNNPF
ncbi:MAG: protein kinase [Deltaproteobacteria bacterium]|nr:protein kinase [Deltaproteobacteria bacterium]